MTARSPRVTVLVPTYERAPRLARALDSILAQTYRDFRLLISDNASTDETCALCKRYARSDARVEYMRQPVNVGPVPNFNWLLSRSGTELTLMVADDDWLARDYIERCLEVMDADPTLAVVVGASRYVEESSSGPSVRDLELTDPSAAVRVLRYLEGESRWSSAAFYGLLRTSAVRLALPIPNVMGADWIFSAAVLFSGCAVTTSSTYLNRERGGTSQSFQRIGEVSGLSGRAVRLPHLAIAFNQFREIAFSSPAYARLSRTRRLLLGLAGGSAVIAGHPLDVLWDTLGPLVLHRRLERFTRVPVERLRAARWR